MAGKSALRRGRRASGLFAIVAVTVAVAAPLAGADEPDPGAPVADSVAGADASADAFYDPPAGYESEAPGTILKSRPIVAKALELFPVNAQAWQLLYRTTDADGSPYAAVTTVLIPDGPAKPRPLLSYQMAYDSIARDCMPSYSLQYSSPLDLLDPAKQSGYALPPWEMAFAASGLAQGWAVAVPDPGGIDDRFLTPRVMGYTTLDGIRAAQNFAPLGLPGADTKTALWGYSGGGIATSWAAELQPDYAPELNIAGAAIGAPVADLGAALHSANGRLLGGLIPIGVAALEKDSPAVAARLDSYLTPTGQGIVAAAGYQCVARNVAANLMLTVPTLLNAPLDTVLADPVIHQAIAERSHGATTPAAPVYLYNGVNDEVSPIGPVDALVQNYCAHGASVTYTRDAFPDVISDHTIVDVTGAGGAFAWVQRALSNPQPVQPAGCTTTTVASTLLDPAGLAALPDFAAGTVETMLGQALGAGR
ncbi:lipase family protein [Nocardia sp. NBC_01388]|uniref:lipase family protein n=1 Tax=Nocardia sp. NBC_01388 TaxID=2903596 RepID=UPI00324B2909